MTGGSVPEIKTRVARAGYKEHAFCGQRVYADLVNQESLTSLIALGVSGRRFDRDETAMLDDIAVCWTIADPRIWPLKIGRLVASYGGCLQGLAAMLLSLDNPYVGIWESTPHSATLLRRLFDDLGSASTRADQVSCWLEQQHPGRGLVPGFGVPFRDQDERVGPLRVQVATRGRSQKTYWRVFETLEAVVHEQRGLAANVAGATAAIMLDLDLTPEQMAPLAVSLGMHMFVANAAEEARQRNPGMQHLGDSRLNYVGTKARRSPRAVLSDDA